MGKFDALGLDELRAKLKELEDLLEEVEEERLIVLGQTNIHLPGRLVVKYENELKEIKEDIATVESLIRERAQG